MNKSSDGEVWEVSSRDHASDGDGWWPLLTDSLHKPRAMESTTLTALLLLAIVSTSDRENMLPGTGRVLNLVCALQQDRDSPPADVAERASVITRLCAALSGLRGELADAANPSQEDRSGRTRL
jgi:hypothetical protein